MPGPLYPLFNISLDKLHDPDTGRWEHHEEFSHYAIDAWTAGIQVLEAWINEHDDAAKEPHRYRVRVWNPIPEAQRNDLTKTVLIGDPVEVLTYDDLLGAKSDQAAADAG